MATKQAIHTTSSAPYAAFDVDHLSSFTSPSAFLNSAVSTTSHWSMEVVSGCACSPDVPDNSSTSPLSLSAHDNSNHFVLGQNFPTAHRGETTVPFTLYYAADARLNLFDPQGRKVTSTIRRGLSAGRHVIKLNLRGLGLPAGEYTYQLQISTRYGVYQQLKTMKLL